MYQGASRAKCNAVGPRLERGVRPRLAATDGLLTLKAKRLNATRQRRECMEGDCDYAAPECCEYVLAEMPALTSRTRDWLRSCYATATGAAGLHRPCP